MPTADSSRADIFINYSLHDEDWVRAWLLPKLKAAHVLPLDFHNFEPGAPRVDEIERAVINSRKTLLVLTPEYFSSEWEEFGGILTSTLDPAAQQRRVLPLILKPCELPLRVRSLVQLDFTKPETRDFEFTRLVEAIKSEDASPDSPVTPQARLFVCYKRKADPDEKLAVYLYDLLAAQNHNVFMDTTLRAGEAWLKEIDEQIKASDFFIALLSRSSADSEMVQAEIRRAYEYRRRQGYPQILPIRINYEGMLPYTIDAFLDPLQYIVWHSQADNEHVSHNILAAIGGQLPKRAPIQLSQASIISEDGRRVPNEETLLAPLPEFDPRHLEALEAPGGTVKLRDKFYIERDSDLQLKSQIIKPGAIITIRASRQTGKSSLLVRGVHYASQQGAKTVNLDVQRIDRDQLRNPEIFLRYLAGYLVRRLQLDVAQVEKAWLGPLGPQDKLSNLMEEYILPNCNAPLILAMDEVDRLLQTDFHSDFFGLVRSWYNAAAFGGEWEKLGIAMAISTEPYLLIADMNQSPFNVGFKINLKDFNDIQVRDLNRRHGAPLGDDQLFGLIELLNGHPYLTRKALFTLVTERLSWIELAQIAATDQGPFNDHLRRYHWQLTDEPNLKEAFKAVLRRDHSSNEKALFRLERAGLIRRETNNLYSCRCRLYDLYFKEHLL